MAADILKLQVLLSLSDKLTGPLARIKGGAQGLSGTLQQTADKLKQLERQQAMVARARGLQTSLSETAQRLRQAQERQASWAAALKAGGAAAKLARPEYTRASEEVKRLTQSQQCLIDQAARLRSAMNNAGLGKLTSDETRLRAEIDKTTKALERQRVSKARMDRMAQAGIAAQGYGYGMYHGGRRALSGMAHMMEPAKHMALEETRARLLKMDPAQTEHAIEYAKKLHVVGTSIVENVGLLGDAMSAFGDVHHAVNALPTIAQIHATNAALFPNDGGDSDRATMEFLKVVDLRGGTLSADKFKHQADMIQRVQTASRGRVNSEQWLQTIQRGGVGAIGMDDAAFYYKMEPVIQMMGGNATGTGLYAIYKNLYQGKGTKRSFQNLDRLGLIADYSKVKQDKAGQVSYLNPGAIKGADTLRTDPVAWMKDVLLPTLAAKGITDEKGIQDAIGGIVSDRSASKLLAIIAKFMPLIERDAARNAHAAGLDESHAGAMNTPEGKKQELMAQRDKLYLRLGDAVLPAYVKLLELLTKGVEAVSSFAERHQTLTKVLAIGAAGIAGLVTGLGALLIPIGMFMAKAWMLNIIFTKTGIGVRGLWGLFAKLAGPLRGVLPAIASFGGRLASLGSMGARMGAVLRGALPAIMGFGRWVWRLRAALNFTGVGALVNMLILAVQLWYQNWEGIKGGAAFLLEDLQALPGKFYNAGAEMIAGLVNGITSKMAALKDKVVGLAGDVSGWFKDKLGIASPSRVFMQFGQFIGDGTALGIAARQPLVSRAALALAASAAAIATPQMGMAGGLMPAAPAFARQQPSTSAPAFGGGTYSIVINAQPGMDPQAIAQAVRRELDNRERAQRGRVLSQLSDME